VTSMTASVSLSQLPSPEMSLTTVRWATEVADPDDDTVVEEVEMFAVVGEQFRLESVEAAAERIGEGTGFLPPRFWLIPDDLNPHDNQAVGVYALAGDRGYHIGFLPRGQTQEFRAGMASIGRPSQSLEVLGCLTQGKSAPHPNGRIYLPVDFARLCSEGYERDPSNQIGWLADASPVRPRPRAGSIGDTFSFDELCKIYCWYAKKRRWFCLPHDCESKADGIRSAGIGLPIADFEPFLGPITTVEKSAPLSKVTIVSAQGDSSQWFYQHSGKEFGPFDSYGLRLEAAAGRLMPEGSVRRGDLAKWVPATRVKGLWPSDAPSSARGDAGSTQSIDSIESFGWLSGEGALPGSWTLGERNEPPKMFDAISRAESRGYRPLLRQQEQKGGVAAFVMRDASDAIGAYEKILSQMGSNVGIVARLGDQARFSYSYMEMPPQLKMPPSESSEVLFRRGRVVVHIRMTQSKPDPVVEFAVNIDSRVAELRPAVE
jgi:hypothetical protein